MKRSLLLVFLIVTLVLISISCGGGGSDSSGDGGCDLVAGEENSNSFLEVDNALDVGIEWYMRDYAFGAFLRPGECTLLGVRPDRQFELRVTRCTSASDHNCPNNGVERTINFSVTDDETYAIVVNDDFF